MRDACEVMGKGYGSLEAGGKGVFREGACMLVAVVGRCWREGVMWAGGGGDAVTARVCDAA